MKEKKGEGKGLARVEEKHHTKTMKAAMKDIEERYYNPDPLFLLIGESNEAEVQIDGNKLTALIDSGAQISAITNSMAKKMKLKIQKLKKLLRIEGTGGGKVPYKGYVEVLLEVPGIQNLSEYILMLVIDDSEYGERVPLQLGTLHIDMVLQKATEEELKTLGKAFDRRRVARPTYSQKGCFNLDLVKGPIKVTKEINVEPGETLKINGLTELKGNTKRLHLVAEPIEHGGGTDPPKIITIPTYSQCMPGSQRIPVMIRMTAALSRIVFPFTVSRFPLAAYAAGGVSTTRPNSFLPFTRVSNGRLY